MAPSHLFSPLSLSLCLLILLLTHLRADTIALFYALDKDWETFVKETGNEASSYRVGTRLLRKVQCGSHEVIAVKMGSGPVETAISAQALLTRFKGRINKITQKL